MTINKINRGRLQTVVLIEKANQISLVRIDITFNNGEIEYIEHFSTIREDVGDYSDFLPKNFSDKDIETYEADNSELLNELDKMRTKDFKQLLQKAFHVEQ